MTTRRLLVVAPHPDDESIASGGLIAAAVGQGWTVQVLAISVGGCRQLLSGATDATTRLAEFSAAQERGGFAGRVALVGEQFMRMDQQAQKVIVDEIEDEVAAYLPHTVVVPPISSYDQDHRAVASACVTALRPRPRALRHFVDVVLEADEPYFWRAEGGRPTPNCFVPLTRDQLETKLALVRCHTSQDRDDPFGRSAENLTRYAQVYGTELGVEYAEAYRVLRINGGLLWN